MTRSSISTLRGVLLGALISLAPALPSQSIVYEGRLEQTGSTSIADGIYPMFFLLFETPTGGDAVWLEHQEVEVIGGAYKATLGAVNPIPSSLFAQRDRYWFELAVDANRNGQFGSNEFFSPRTPLNAVPSALNKREPVSEVANVTRPFPLADTPVDYGTVVSLYSDGFVRRATSLVPFGETEYLAPPGADVHRASYAFKVTGVEPDLLVTSYIRLGEVGLEDRGTMQFATRIDAEGRPTLGPPVAIGANLGGIQPLTALVRRTPTGEAVLLNLTEGEMLGLRLNLTAVAPDGTIRVGPSVDLPPPPAASPDLHPAYEVVQLEPMITGDGPARFLLTRGNLGQSVDVDFDPDESDPLSATIRLGLDNTVPLGGALPVDERRFFGLFRDSSRVRWREYEIKELGGPIGGTSRLLTNAPPIPFSIQSQTSQPVYTTIRHARISETASLLVIAPDMISQARGLQVMLVGVGKSPMQLTYRDAVNIDGVATSYCAPVLLCDGRFVVSLRDRLVFGRLEGEDRLGIINSTSLPSLDAGIGLVFRQFAAFRALSFEPNRVQTLLRLGVLDELYGIPVGVTAAAANPGQTVPVVVRGVLGGFSGLTTGETYYGTTTNLNPSLPLAEQIRREGRLTLDPTPVKVGTALSSSELLIRMD
jgi:hypothetical protein